MDIIVLDTMKCNFICLWTANSGSNPLKWTINEKALGVTVVARISIFQLN